MGQAIYFRWIPAVTRDRNIILALLTKAPSPINQAQDLDSQHKIADVPQIGLRHEIGDQQAHCAGSEQDSKSGGINNNIAPQFHRKPSQINPNDEEQKKEDEIYGSFDCEVTVQNYGLPRKRLGIEQDTEAGRYYSPG